MKDPEENKRNTTQDNKIEKNNDYNL